MFCSSTTRWVRHGVGPRSQRINSHAIWGKLQDERQSKPLVLLSPPSSTMGVSSTGGTHGTAVSAQGKLKDVQQVQATSCAFAALLRDGSVVTCGRADFGGDCRLVQHKLKDVQAVQASRSAFADPWRPVCRHLGRCT